VKCKVVGLYRADDLTDEWKGSGGEDRNARRSPYGRVPANGAPLLDPPLYEKNYGSEHAAVVQAPRRGRKYQYGAGYEAGHESPGGEDVNFSDTRTMARARRAELGRVDGTPARSRASEARRRPRLSD